MICLYYVLYDKIIRNFDTFELLTKNNHNFKNNTSAMWESLAH